MSIPVTAEVIPAPVTEGPSSPTARGRPRTQCCCLCSRPNRGDLVEAGGDIGRVHRACFGEWDRRQEALEATFMLPLSLPDAREGSSEVEVDGPLARAA